MNIEIALTLLALLAGIAAITFAVLWLLTRGVAYHDRRRGNVRSFAVLWLLAGSLMFSGCRTTPTGQSIPDPAVMTMIAQGAASIGTQTWLVSHPNDREEFELARKSLRALLALGNGSPADLQEVLARLPIKQLSGPDGQVIVSGAVILLDAAGRELAKFDSVHAWSYYVEPVARGLLAGLDQALGPEEAKLRSNFRFAVAEYWRIQNRVFASLPPPITWCCVYGCTVDHSKFDLNGKPIAQR